MKTAIRYVLAITVMAFSLLANATVPLDQGKFFLSRAVRGEEFASLMLNYQKFSDAYLTVTSDSDLYPCEGWGRFEKVFPSYVEMCTVTSKLGYDVQVKSQLKGKVQNTPNSACQAQVTLSLQIMPGTRPALLSDNVSQVHTTFCLGQDGKTVNYNSSITEGPSKGLLFVFIAAEFKKMIPPMNKSVQYLMQ